MYDLAVQDYSGVEVVDSRDIADMVERDHAELLKTIRIYMGYLGEGDFPLTDFFIESTYLDVQGKERLNYLITKKGCDMVANKMIGAKGVLFTAAYVTAFEKMKAHLLKPMTTAEIVAAMAQNNVELERKVLSLETKTAEVEEKLTQHTNRLDSAIEIFSKPTDRSWRKSTNEAINRICMQYDLNYQFFKGQLYAELEETGHCDLANRQTRIRNRMKTAGTTSRERQAISKIDVIDRDPKLKLIFDGIVRKYQAKMIGEK